MSLKNGNKNKKPETIQLSPEDASVARMRIVEKNLMNSLSLASKETKRTNLGDPTVYEVMKVLSRMQHHYAGIGVEFQWEQNNQQNEKTLDESKVVPIGNK